MKFISFKELKEKLGAGESVEELAKKYWVVFSIDNDLIPKHIPVEKLIEIIEKAPELFIQGENIPVWAFLLLLVRGKFDIAANIVVDIFNQRKGLARYQKEEDVSNIIVCNNIETIKQVTKEQISELLSIIEKRKDRFLKYSKNFTTYFLIKWFLQPVKDYLSKECFLLILDWVVEKINLSSFKELFYAFFGQIPMDNQSVQEKIAAYFTSVRPPWIFSPPYDMVDIFKEKEAIKKINTEYFVSYVAKAFPKLHDSKKVYLLNLPIFIEKYPHLAIKSLKVFLGNMFNHSHFIIIDKIFISNEVWDILSTKDPLFFLKLIIDLPNSRFYFDVDYVLDKAKFPLFLYPESSEEVYNSLKILKEEFAKLTKK